MDIIYNHNNLYMIQSISVEINIINNINNG